MPKKPIRDKTNLSFYHRSRSPSNRIPFAAQSDCVRVTMTFREAFTAKIRKRRWNNDCFYYPKNNDSKDSAALAAESLLFS